MPVQQQQTGEERKAHNVHCRHNLRLTALTFLMVGTHAHGFTNGDDSSLLDEGFGGWDEDIPGDEVACLHVDEVAEDASVASW